ncbi:hypothetical protein JGU71_14840 [Antrihabitans sp. YC3-6]|uniref:Trypsin-co-occurring domain-containing protein n=1 Tax=Antrihabitans stalagmiti TaxID=2799499 RepID=A0A934NRK3_9NOCA|nr:trypco2 family protein [Antrihabitans stalagmiti]MBJ8340164.1 hypothetical protein [Antrihabitans stalagmiti]
MADQNWVGLSDALEVLKRQLIESEAKNRDEQVSFSYGKLEVELALQLRGSDSAPDGLEFGLTTVNDDATVATAPIHRISLQLQLRDNGLPLKGARHRRA